MLRTERVSQCIFICSRVLCPELTDVTLLSQHSCRLCQSTELELVLKLTPTVRKLNGNSALRVRFVRDLDHVLIKFPAPPTTFYQPPANSFVPKEELEAHKELFPLQVNFCKSCTHVQLSHVISPESLFRNYVYVSGTSPVMVQHLKAYALEAAEFSSICEKDLVFEFGSNDGTLLQHFKDLGFPVLGMDPAKNLAEQATAAGLPTIPDFFSAQSARQVVADHGKVRLICSNHCCAHIDDLRGVMQGVSEMLAPNGIWVFEVGYLLSVFQNSLFDTIYHEHVDFHTVEPIRRACESFGMRLLNASKNSIQGGSLRCFVGWPSDTPLIREGAHNVSELIREELAAGLHKPATFLRWVRNSILPLNPSFVQFLTLPLFSYSHSLLQHS